MKDNPGLLGQVFTIIAIRTKVVNVPFFVLYALLLNTFTRTIWERVHLRTPSPPWGERAGVRGGSVSRVHSRIYVNNPG